jgi:hypothetical protein
MEIEKGIEKGIEKLVQYSMLVIAEEMNRGFPHFERLSNVEILEKISEMKESQSKVFQISEKIMEKMDPSLKRKQIFMFLYRQKAMKKLKDIIAERG